MAKTTKKAYIINTEIISPLGFSVQENYENLVNGLSGIKYIEDKNYLDKAFFGAQLPEKALEKAFEDLSATSKNYTKLEKMLLLAVDKVLDKNPDLDLNKTAVIISTTKGNIDALSHDNPFPKERAKLFELANQLQTFFNLPQTPIVLSNACISGGLAIAVGKKLITHQNYDHALIVGGDILSKFTVSGFSSFQALDSKICAPFCKERNGINLGEAAACILLSAKPTSQKGISIDGEATANDANHISGPSKTGDGLYKSIQNALKEAQLTAKEIDFISAHGTATIYNDEMEAKAFSRAGLQDIPLNSLKAHYGHTLGASALLETIISVECMKRNQLLPNFNFTEMGTSKKLEIITKLSQKSLKNVLKTASGFGGCNFAMLLKKQA